MQKYKKMKYKSTSVLLAVFLSFFAWLYTYDEDRYKFWTGCLLSVLLVWTFVVPIGVWLWVIIDVCRRRKDFYECYFN
jgi:hypothetical protein